MSSLLTASQTAILLLWQQVNASLSAYKKLIKAFFNAENALNASSQQWRELGLHAKHIERHQDAESNQKLLDNVHVALQQGSYQLIFADDDTFPQQLTELFDPPPLLFVRGNAARLNEAQIAIVGSRKPTPHAQKISFDMAQYLAQAGYVITSGLAQGVDYYAHTGALSALDATNHDKQNLSLGRTIGVMGTGIDVCYPKNHSTLFTQIVAAGGCLVSELLPQTPANKHTFPRRNRLVAGLSLGTIVTEATIKSGSLITARLTSEQGKQIFAIPSHIDNVNAEGCHHLIREGATLIYHPQQVLDDLKYQQIQPIVYSSAQNKSTLVLKDKITDSDDKVLTDSTTDSTKPLLNQNSLVQSDRSQPIATDNTTKSNQPLLLPLPNTELPNHLSTLFSQIDWTGVAVDKLVTVLKLDTQTLLGQLMELELMGLIMQQGGRYVRA